MVVFGVLLLVVTLAVTILLLCVSPCCGCDVAADGNSHGAVDCRQECIPYMRWRVRLLLWRCRLFFLPAIYNLCSSARRRLVEALRNFGTGRKS